jgi:rhodanese-related sulfurtransferase
VKLTAERKRQFKNDVYEVFAEVGKAFSNGHRLELIDLLSQADRSVEQLAILSNMSVANTSQHLQVLRRAGLVDVRRDGTRAFYRLADKTAFELWRSLRTFSESQLPAVDHVVNTYLEEREDLAAIDADELHLRLGEGDVVLLDVRPVEEYGAGHIPGARSIPIGDLEDRLDELPRDREVIAYCRGRYCVYSDEAVRLLQERGFRARRFEMGVLDWEVTR